MTSNYLYLFLYLMCISFSLPCYPLLVLVINNINNIILEDYLELRGYTYERVDGAVTG